MAAAAKAPLLFPCVSFAFAFAFAISEAFAFGVAFDVALAFAFGVAHGVALYFALFAFGITASSVISIYAFLHSVRHKYFRFPPQRPS